MRRLHPSVEQVMEFFDYEHLPEDLQSVSRPFHDLAQHMAWDLETERGHEVMTGLRKLLEAKDCFVRAALPRKAQREKTE